MYSVNPFKSLFQLLEAFPTEQSCIDHLEFVRWNNIPISPFDKTSIVYKCKDNKYRCKNTKKYFNVKTETLMEGSKIPLKLWFLSIYLFTTSKKGISSYQLAEQLSITQKTSWFLLSRIRYAMQHDIFIKEMAKGIVEIDETFVGGKNKNRHWDKKIKGSQGRSFKDKTPVVGFYSEGKVKCEIINDTNNQSLHPAVLKHVAYNSTIVTDEWRPYTFLGRNYYHQEIVDHSRSQYVNENGFTTNRIENFWSVFKRGLIGTYQNKVSKKHLQNYVNEFTFRFNERESKVDDRFNLLLSLSQGKRLTYKNLVTYGISKS